MISAAFIRVEDILQAHAAEDKAYRSGDRRAAEDHFERGVELVCAAARQEPLSQAEAVERLKIAIWLWQLCDLDTRMDAIKAHQEAQTEIAEHGVTGYALNRVRRAMTVATSHEPAARAIVGFWNAVAVLK